jgi:PAS domain-containing protein
MAPKDVELILARQLASYISTPMVIVDPELNVVFYNESAEPILGSRFDETGEMPATVWARAEFTDESGTPLSLDELPLPRVLRDGGPVHGTICVRSLDQVKRHLAVTAFPLIGLAGHILGALAIFWEPPTRCE